MSFRIIIFLILVFIVGCASTQETPESSTDTNDKQDSNRNPAMSAAYGTPSEFRNHYSKDNVLTTSLPKKVSDMISFAEDDLSSSAAARQCRSFFFEKNTGKVGPLAKHVLNYLTNEWEATIKNPSSPSPFFKDNVPDIIFPKRCPNFKNFSPEQKILFWTYVMQNLAFKESSCVPTTVNHNPDVPNGPAVGLFQLELRQSLRVWRGEGCKVPTNAIKGAKENTDCALKILKSQLSKTSHMYGKYPIESGKTPLSYWHGFNYSNKVWTWIDGRVKGMCLALAGE